MQLILIFLLFLTKSLGSPSTTPHITTLDVLLFYHLLGQVPNCYQIKTFVILQHGNPTFFLLVEKI